MPVPSEYQRASLDFEKFLSDARDASGLTTTNQAARPDIDGSRLDAVLAKLPPGACDFWKA